MPPGRIDFAIGHSANTTCSDARAVEHYVRYQAVRVKVSRNADMWQRPLVSDDTGIPHALVEVLEIYRHVDAERLESCAAVDLGGKLLGIQDSKLDILACENPWRRVNITSDTTSANQGLLDASSFAQSLASFCMSWTLFQRRASDAVSTGSVKLSQATLPSMLTPDSG